jgi:transposase-like protein
MSNLRVSIKTIRKQKKYTEAFKRQVVREFEKGLVTKDQLSRKYGIAGKSAVLKWCRKYGKFDYPKHGHLSSSMKDPQKQRIRELEQKLKAAELKLKVYDKLIEITNRELDADVVKKIEAKLSESWQQKEK